MKERKGKNMTEKKNGSGSHRSHRPEFQAWGVLHFRDVSDDGVGWTVYYNYSENNIGIAGTPLLLGFARCNEKTYDKRIGRELAEKRVKPHHIPLDLDRAIHSKSDLLYYIKDYMLCFVIPRNDMLGFRTEEGLCPKKIWFEEMPRKEGQQKGVWYGRCARY